MSSFFTLPASQRKRKRVQAAAQSKQNGTSKGRRQEDDDESISGSDVSGDVGDILDHSEEDSEDDELAEDPAAKRIRLAEQYLANTRQEALDEVGFDAEDVDQENLRRRMGERLKEDTAEGRGKLYKFVADELDWSSSSCAQFRTNTKTVTGVAVAAGHVYTVSKDMALIKWKLGDVATQKPKIVRYTRGNSNAAEHHQKAILCVAASNDGKFVATGGADNRLIVWDATTLKCLRVFTGQARDNGHRDSVLALAFRRTSNQLFSASKDRTVKVWSCDELAYVETLFGHQDEVLDVAALSREICVSAGARDKTARYWKVVEETQLVFRGGGPSKNAKDSGIDISELEFAGEEGSIDRVAFVDDDTFVTGSDNGALTLWSIHRKKPVFSLPLAHGLHPPPTLEQRTAELDIDDQYKDVEIMGELPPTPRWITALRVVPYSNVVLSGSWDGHVRAFRITEDRRRIERIGPVGTAAHDGFINDISVVELGDRGKDGLLVAAAVGQEHRLGKWQSFKSKNTALIFQVPKKAVLEEADEAPKENGFEGFQ